MMNLTSAYPELFLVLAAPFLCVTLFGPGFSGSIDELRVLSAGAFGIVALKLLQEDEGSKSRLQRFRRELRMARKVTHPNVVRIHDLVELPGADQVTCEVHDFQILQKPFLANEIMNQIRSRLSSDSAGAN